MSNDNRAYWAKRALVEREQAKQACNPDAAHIHGLLADTYHQMATSGQTRRVLSIKA
jgi:hypothetical protein